MDYPCWLVIFLCYCLLTDEMIFRWACAYEVICLNLLIVPFPFRCLTQEDQDTLLHCPLMTNVVEGLSQGPCLEAGQGIFPYLSSESSWVSVFYFWMRLYVTGSKRLCYVRSVSSDAENPGNSLYVTGLSHRVTERDLENHFSKEGKVRCFNIF